MKTVHPEHRCQRLCLQDVRGEAVGHKDRPDTVHAERVTRKEAPDTPRPLVSGQSPGGCGGGRGEAGPGACRGSAPRARVQMGPMLHKPARVLRSVWKLHLLSVDRWSQVLLIPCVLLALCPTPQHPLLSLKEFVCPEGKHISCVSVFLNSGGRLPWILGFPGRA